MSARSPDALPPELRTAVAEFTWSTTLTDLPDEFRQRIAQNFCGPDFDHGRGNLSDARMAGRLMCVSRSAFRSAHLEYWLNNERDDWLRYWIRIDGLPICPIAEQGRRLSHAHARARARLLGRRRLL